MPEAARFCGECGGGRASDDRLLGEVVADRYRIVAPLGEGAMSKVYLAEQRLGLAVRSVAVKVLRFKGPAGRSLAARFHRECETLAGLSHPNIVEVYDFGALPDGTLYLVMEQVDGGSLADALDARGPLPWEEGARLIVQIASALSAVHARGVVHRDLKPENVLLRRDGFVKLADFGIAKRLAEEENELTQPGMVLGTPATMSPEQLGAGKVDARSDIYSLGVLSYHLLTGRLPFNAESPLQWAAAHLTEVPRPIETHRGAERIPDAARRVIMQALAKRPDDRPADVDEVARRMVGTGLASSWTLATAHDTELRASLGSVPPPPRRRRGRLFALLAAVVVLTLAVGFAVGGQMSAHPPAEVLPPPPSVAMRVTEPEAPPGWVTVVNQVRDADDAEAMLGPPDDRFARIRSRGWIILQTSAPVAADGTPAPELEIVAAPDSGAYAVEVSGDGRRFVRLIPRVRGTIWLDLDAHDLAAIRHIRLVGRWKRPAEIDAIRPLPR